METPLPTEEKKKVPIMSFKAKGEQLVYLQSLIAEKGTMTKALEHVTELAMTPRDGSVKTHLQFEGLKKQIEELSTENKSQKKFIDDYILREKQFRTEIESLKTQISKLKPSGTPAEVKKDAWSW